MDVRKLLSVTSPFYESVGRVVEEITRLSIDEMDIDFLQLRRSELTEQLENARKNLAEAAELDKKNRFAELADRGLSGSSIREAVHHNVNTEAADELETIHREYIRAIENIGLIERKINSNAEDDSAVNELRGKVSIESVGVDNIRDDVPSSVEG